MEHGETDNLRVYFPESWLEMTADHFGIVAENLAIAFFALEKKSKDKIGTGLLEILADLREWDGQACGQDDVFTLLRPVIVAMVSRARSKGDRVPPCILDLRLHLSETVNSAATLIAARWFIESVVVYYDIRRKLYV